MSGYLTSKEERDYLTDEKKREGWREHYKKNRDKILAGVSRHQDKKYFETHGEPRPKRKKREPKVYKLQEGVTI